jgi:peptidoglycan/LPS O-acetylase OafA/YrhL
MLPALLTWLALPLLFSEIPTGSPLLLLIVSPYTVLFIIGALTGLLIQAGWRRFAGSALIAGLVLIVIGIVAFVHFDAYGRSDWYSVIFLGLPFVPFLYALAILEPKIPTPSLLVKLGDASYSTYLSHTFVVSGLGRLFHALHPQGFSAEAAYFVVAVASANIVGLLSYRLLEQPLLKLTRIRSLQATRLSAGARS